MDDKEFLKLAAKAAGIGLKFSADESVSPRLEKTWTSWNPLTDDGDALRLAVKLSIGVSHHDATHICDTEYGEYLSDEVDVIGDGLAATRRAIVRAAAEIGKNMP